MSATLIRDDKTVLSLTSDEVEQARAFKARVDEANTATLEASNEVFVGLRSGETVEMPAELSSLVRQVLDIVSRGGTVTVGSVPNEVTTTTAAKMLGISRPTLMKLVKDNQLAAHRSVHIPACSARMSSRTRIYSAPTKGRRLTIFVRLRTSSASSTNCRLWTDLTACVPPLVPCSSWKWAEHKRSCRRQHSLFTHTS